MRNVLLNCVILTFIVAGALGCDKSGSASPSADSAPATGTAASRATANDPAPVDSRFAEALAADQQQKALAQRVQQLAEMLKKVTADTTLVAAENSSLKNAVAAVTVERDRLKSQLAAPSAAEISLKNRLDGLEAACRNTGAMAAALTNENSKLKATVAALTAQRENLKSQPSMPSATEIALRNRLDALELAGKQSQDNARQLESILAGLRDENHQLKDTVTQRGAAVQRLGESVYHLTHDLDDAKEEAKRLADARNAAAADADQARNQLAQANSAAAELRSQVSGIQAEMESIQGQLNRAQSEIAANRESSYGQPVVVAPPASSQTVVRYYTNAPSEYYPSPRYVVVRPAYPPVVYHVVHRR